MFRKDCEDFEKLTFSKARVNLIEGAGHSKQRLFIKQFSRVIGNT